MDNTVLMACGLFMALFVAVTYLIMPASDRMKRKIVMGTILLAVFGAVCFRWDTFFPEKLGFTSTESDSEKPLEEKGPRSFDQSMGVVAEIDDSCRYKKLGEEAIRGKITEAKGKDDIVEALSLLPCLSSESAREEECKSIFGYCIDQGLHTEAKLAISCLGSQQAIDDAEQELELEQIKAERH